MLPLRSAQKLAWCVGIPLEELRSLAKNVDKHYRSWKKTDPVKGKERTFIVPDQELKRVQRRILRRVLSTFDLPNGAPGRSGGNPLHPSRAYPVPPVPRTGRNQRNLRPQAALGLLRSSDRRTPPPRRHLAVCGLPSLLTDAFCVDSQLG